MNSLKYLLSSFRFPYEKIESLTWFWDREYVFPSIGTIILLSLLDIHVNSQPITLSFWVQWLFDTILEYQVSRGSSECNLQTYHWKFKKYLVISMFWFLPSKLCLSWRFCALLKTHIRGTDQFKPLGEVVLWYTDYYIEMMYMKCRRIPPS